jgi:hypothetical protein
MQTFTGKAFYFDTPHVSTIDIEDIAHSLAMQCRFNGHTRAFYSVAEHSVRVSWAVEAASAGQVGAVELALWALLHDASEAYTGDVVLPLKREMRGHRFAPVFSLPSDFDLIENRIQRVICQAFALPEAEPKIVKRFDLVLLVTEKRDLLAPCDEPWPDYGVQPLRHRLETCVPEQAKKVFLDRFHELMAARGEAKGAA